MEIDAHLDLSRWTEKPRGLAYRRWVMISNGLRLVFRGRILRLLLFIAWSAGLFLAAMGFVFSQSLAGGWLEEAATALGPRAQAIVSGIAALLLLYPDIVVRGIYTALFWVHSYFGMFFTLVVLTIIVPQLIARDRASNALTIYLSRPLTSGDYLIGKLGIVAGVIFLTWVGPLLMGWGLSMCLAPNLDFLVHSFPALLRALLFSAIALVVLAFVALGVSALTRSSAGAVAMWSGLWLIAGFIAAIPDSPAWIKGASFTHNLSVVRSSVFRFDAVLAEAAATLPLMNRELTEGLASAGQSIAAQDVRSAYIALAVMVIAASAVFLNRIRSE